MKNFKTFYVSSTKVRMAQNWLGRPLQLLPLNFQLHFIGYNFLSLPPSSCIYLFVIVVQVLNLCLLSILARMIGVYLYAWLIFLLNQNKQKSLPCVLLSFLQLEGVNCLEAEADFHILKRT